jgi:hypothetical protein
MAYEVARSARTRPRRALRRVLLLVVGLTLFVCCVGAAGLGAWNYQSIRRAAGPAQQAADRFLGDVRSGDQSGAYDRLCADTRARWSRPQFALRVSTPPTINRYAIENVKITSKDGQQRAAVSVALTRDSGAVDNHTLPMVKGDDGWQVCGDPF